MYVTKYLKLNCMKTTIFSVPFDLHLIIHYITGKISFTYTTDLFKIISYFALFFRNNICEQFQHGLI